jgi:hypothetical protein
MRHEFLDVLSAHPTPRSPACRFLIHAKTDALGIASRRLARCPLPGTRLRLPGHTGAPEPRSLAAEGGHRSRPRHAGGRMHAPKRRTYSVSAQPDYFANRRTCTSSQRPVASTVLMVSLVSDGARGVDPRPRRSRPRTRWPERAQLFPRKVRLPPPPLDPPGSKEPTSNWGQPPPRRDTASCSCPSPRSEETAQQPWRRWRRPSGAS